MQKPQNNITIILSASSWTITIIMSTSQNTANSVAYAIIQSSATMSNQNRKKFLNLIYMLFNHSPKLQNIFSKNNVRISYSCIKKSTNLYLDKKICHTKQTFNNLKRKQPTIKEGNCRKNKITRCLNKALSNKANIQI